VSGGDTVSRRAICNADHRSDHEYDDGDGGKRPDENAMWPLRESHVVRVCWHDDLQVMA
jgi:hypothetical protein